LRITIPLTEDTGDALRLLASREYRDPRNQARLLLVEALRARGALPAESTVAIVANDRSPLTAA
jgi:hypothetical protein